MTNNKNPHSRNINMGKNGNYNETIGRDYIQGNIYNNYQINIPQETKEQIAAKQLNYQEQHNEPTVSSELVINSSGNWVLINNHFFQCETVHQLNNGTLTVKILSESSEEDAIIRSLRPDRFKQSNLVAVFISDVQRRTKDFFRIGKTVSYLSSQSRKRC
ncbi:MAG: hypothetical protein MUD14_08610 [Hydrococcus sp. Prado102]|jgi:hypothetical protein|nr:hypothetical protein [Hydrococcus sp. Prado102]